MTMKKQKLLIVSLTFIIICTIFGGFLGIYIFGEDPSKYAVEIIGGTILGTVITLLLGKLNKKRNGNIPDIDERTLTLMKRYLMIVLYFVLFGSEAILLILYSMGVHTIDTGMLIVCLGGVYILIGFGAIITKHL